MRLAVPEPFMPTPLPSARPVTAALSADPAPHGAGQVVSTTPGEREFRALCSAFRNSGGMLRGDDLARLLEDHRCGDFVSLARFISRHEIFSFDWREAVWVPMFQFDLRDLSIRPGPQRVLAELGGAYDGWALASWFSQPNVWLRGARPVDLLDADLGHVLRAARADRFVAKG